MSMYGKRRLVTTKENGDSRLAKYPRHESIEKSHASKYEGLTPSQIMMADLMSACRSTLKPHDAEGEALLLKVEKIYSKANKSYVESDEFVRRVQKTSNEVRLHPGKMWVLTRDFFQELKAYKQKIKPTPVVEPLAAAEGEGSGASNDDEGAGKTTTKQEGSDANGQEESDSNQSDSRPHKASASQILRLEELLQSHHKEIERYDNMELSLDDLGSEDSYYLICERLKGRAAKIFNRLCELKNRSTNKGGAREKKFKYSGSRYHELNVSIQRFVNKHDFEERMPDYSDIKKIVKLSNEKYLYHLNPNRIMELSKEVFLDVGSIISSIRKKDFQHDFGPANASRALTQEVEDPATFSSSLKDKLKANKSLADKNLKSEFQKWADIEAAELDKASDKKSGKSRSDEEDEESKESEDESSSSEEEDDILAKAEQEDTTVETLDQAAKEDKEDSNGKSPDIEKLAESGESSSEEVASDDESDQDVADLSGVEKSSDSEGEGEKVPCEEDRDETADKELLGEGDEELVYEATDSLDDDQLTASDIIPASDKSAHEVIELSDSD